MSWSPPEPFPVDLLANLGAPPGSHHIVELRYGDGELTGTAGGSAVALALPPLKWQRQASVAGSCGERPALADWRMVHVGARGGTEAYAAGLSGHLGGAVLDIEGAVSFDPSGHPFRRAVVAGELLGLGLEAHITTGEAVGQAREAYIVSGGLYAGRERLQARHARFHGARSLSFAFYVATGGAAGRFFVRGHTSEGAVSLDLTPTNRAAGAVDARGFFEGPTAILLLLVGTAVQWAGRRPPSAPRA